jgi:outer membrane protein
LIRQAASEAVSANVVIEFPDDKQFTADWSIAGIDAAIDRALSDSDVDVVLMLGILSSQQAARRTFLSKPVIAPTVIDPILQGFPLSNGQSGRRNFTYVADFKGIGNDIRAFQQIVGFEHLVALVDEALLKALPEVSEKAAALAADLHTRISIVSTLDRADMALEALPADTDAVYVTGLLRFNDTEVRALAEGLASKRLPSFSLVGRSELQGGLLLTSGGAERDLQRLARRIVLMIQRIALGENPSTFEVSFPTEQRFAINMEVASQIGFSPRWDFLADAEQIRSGTDAPITRLTLLDAMQAALDASPLLEASDARQASSGDDVSIARSRLLPSLDLTATGSRIDADRASALTQAEKSSSVGLSSKQLIYSERAWASYAISRSLYVAAQQGYRQDMLDVLQASASAYFELLRSQSVEAVRRSSVENTRQNLETSRVREQVGLAGRSDNLRWVAELAREKQNLLAAESAHRQAETSLRRIMHWPATQPFETVTTGIDSPLQLVSNPRTQAYIETPARWEVFTEFAVQTALQQSPELAQSEAIIESRRRSVTASRRAYYLPELALVSKSSSLLSQSGAGSAYLPGGPDDSSWSVSIQASWPLFAGGQRSAELSKAQRDLRAAEADRLAAADTVEARARTALHRTTASYGAIDLSRVAANAATENLQMVTEAYGRGAVSVTDLIDAQDTALEANLAAADAYYNFLRDFVDVLRAMSDFDILLDPGSREAWFQRVDNWFSMHAPQQTMPGSER